MSNERNKNEENRSLDTIETETERTWKAKNIPGCNKSVTSGGSEDAAAMCSSSKLCSGEKVDFYIIKREIGVGGTGTVYEAIDESLDRKVALKILHPTPRKPPEQLLEEAKVLAKISHPNVVVVYGSGIHCGQVWIAMELVKGRTLRKWALERTHPWPEIIRVLIEMARGISAIHSAGIIHCDIKPENAMIDDCGRIRVMDFGFALVLPHGSGVTLSICPPSGGTPPYVAPELRCGICATAAVDQYAWSVTAWEFMFGEHPFPTIDSALVGKIRLPPSHRRVPKWIQRVLVRGLARFPSQRWRSMNELIIELEQGETLVRSNMVKLALTILLLLGSGIAGFWHWNESVLVDLCMSSSSRFDAIWNPEVKRDLHTAFLRTNLSFASATWTGVELELDDRARAWKEEHAVVCFRTEVLGEWSQMMRIHAEECLGQRMSDFASLVDEFRHADTTTVQKAVVAASRLRSKEGCPGEISLLQSPESLAHYYALSSNVQAQISRARALEFVGKYENALNVLRGAMSEVKASSRRLALLPMLYVEEAHLLNELGRYDKAEAAGMKAYSIAHGSNNWLDSARASTKLTSIVMHQNRPGESRLWAFYADNVIAKAGDPLALLQAERLTYLGMMSQAEGDYKNARSTYERVLRLTEDALGAEHPQTATILNNLATVTGLLGENLKALDYQTRALYIREKTLGPDHPDVASSLNNLAIIYYNKKNYRQAQRMYRRALSIFLRAFGEQHSKVAITMSNLATVADALGEPGEALALYEHALRIQEGILGDEHPSVANSLCGIAGVHLGYGHFFAARAYAQRAVDIFDRTQGLQLNEGEAHFILAESLNATSAEHDRAVQEAEIARDRFRSAGPGKVGRMEEVERWLIKLRAEGQMQ